MTPTSLRECLDQLGWSTSELAARADVSPVTARRWLSGKLPIPDSVASIIGAMSALAEGLAQKP
jgi:transcriptional regulator with XRE-family HTH domain